MVHVGESTNGLTWRGPDRCDWTLELLHILVYICSTEFTKPVLQFRTNVGHRRTNVFSTFVNKIWRDREACLLRVDTRYVCFSALPHAHRWLHWMQLLTEEHVEHVQQFLPSKVRHVFVFVGCCGIQVSGTKGENNRSVWQYVHCINFL
jgi:hypothetical protein